MQTHGCDDTLAQLHSAAFDLVLVNRKLDRGYSDGLEVIRRIKQDASVADTPCMLITNFPEHQARAVEEGAVSGFGKAELDRPETVGILRRILD